MTRDQKLQRAITYVTESHVPIHGGYPYDYDDQVCPGKVIVAELDDAKERNRTSIHVYENEELVAWVDRAATLAKRNGIDFDEAMLETMPDSVDD